jgi:hypothetical protein
MTTQHVSISLRPLQSLAAVILLATSMGCATNSELAKVQTEVRDAQRTADQALSSAQEANARSQRTEEMLNRSYKHSMRK